MQYREIITSAWKVSWQKKYLWFFGLFAALLGYKGEYEVLLRGISGNIEEGIFSGESLKRIGETGFFKAGTISNAGHLFATEPFTIISMIFLILLLILIIGFVLWFAIVSQTAIVNNTALYLDKKENDFEEGIMSGIKNFWPVAGLNVIMKFAIYLCFVIISLPIIISRGGEEGFFISNTVYFFFFIVFIPVAIIFSFVIKYAINYTVIKKEKFTASIQKGWDLFVKNWLVSLEVAFLIYFISFFAGLIIALGAIMLIIPFLFLSAIFYKAVSLAGFWIIALLGFIVILVFVFCAFSLLSTFQNSASTVLFMRLLDGGIKSKLVRIFEKK